MLILCRILHAFGLPQQAPNMLRIIGALGTFLVLTALAIWGLFLVITA